MNFLTQPLSTFHQKQEFRCGNEQLDRYLHKQAKQDVRRRLAACFVLAEDNGRIKGYYTLSNSGLQREKLPESIKNRLPIAYHNLPVTLLGRLAISKLFQGQGIGELLLFDALKRSFYASVEIGSMAVVVDPIAETIIPFYQRYGFIHLEGSGKLFLPMKTITSLF